MVKPICGVYEIVSPDGGRYIGSSIDVTRRWKQHRRSLAGGEHENFVLQRAFNKHGDSLVFRVLEECGRNELHEREQLYMDRTQRLYNLQPRAGAGGSFGWVPSETVRAKLRAARAKRVFTDETKARISASQKGRVQNPDAIARMRITKTGKPTAQSVGASGYKGVTFTQGKWVARVTKPTGGTRHVGRFGTPELAYAMRLAWLAVEGWT